MGKQELDNLVKIGTLKAEAASRKEFMALTHPFVMAGLVPAIHAPGLSVATTIRLMARGHVFDLFVFPRRGCSAQGRA
jgi:hypothetical protein